MTRAPVESGHYPGCAVAGCDACDCELSPRAVAWRREQARLRMEAELRERPWRGISVDIGKEHR